MVGGRYAVVGVCLGWLAIPSRQEATDTLVRTKALHNHCLKACASGLSSQAISK